MKNTLTSTWCWLNAHAPTLYYPQLVMEESEAEDLEDVEESEANSEANKEN